MGGGGGRVGGRWVGVYRGWGRDVGGRVGVRCGGEVEEGRDALNSCHNGNSMMTSYMT